MKVIYFFDGLGNQMFQYAFYRALQKKYKYVFANIDSFKRDKRVHNGYELEKAFNIKILEKKIFLDNFFSRTRLKKITIFHKIIHKILRYLGLIIYVEDWSEEVEEKLNKKRVIFYIGWWQSEEFFLDIEDEIRGEFEFSMPEDKKNKEIIEEISKNNSVSIHVRRGDYVNDEGLGGLAPLEYYREAINYIKEREKNLKFYIFSNDIKWCKENLDLYSEECCYIDWNIGENSFRDMQLMSVCKHNIIPNSSFSWWGAWLNKNKNKIVIAPEKWFNDCTKMDYSRIVPKNWIKLKNY